MKKLYIGNIPFSTTEEEIRALFEPFGSIETLDLINDRDTGRFRGFGFVELEDAVADKARAELDGKELGGRMLRINEAEDRPKRQDYRW